MDYTPPIINDKNVTPDSSGAVGIWSVEASDLGFPPGIWPRRLETTLGNGKPLALSDLSESGGNYRQEGSQVLLWIFND